MRVTRHHDGSTKLGRFVAAAPNFARRELWRYGQFNQLLAFVQ